MIKKQKRWLFLGSLMCLVGGGFHISYGMINDVEEKDKPQEFTQVSNELVLMDKEKQEEQELFLPDEMFGLVMSFLSPKDILHFGQTSKSSYKISQANHVWKQKAINLEINEVEMQKALKGFFTYQQIVKGKMLWDRFNRIKNSENKDIQLNLYCLKESSECGNEDAIRWLLLVCVYGGYDEFQKNDPKGLELGKRHAEKGSKNAILYLLDAHLHGSYGLKANDLEGLVFAQEYADKGSEEAIIHHLRAYLFGWYRLERNEPKALELAKKYVDVDSEVAKDFLERHR